MPIAHQSEHQRGRDEPYRTPFQSHGESPELPVEKITPDSLDRLYPTRSSGGNFEGFLSRPPQQPAGLVAGHLKRAEPVAAADGVAGQAFQRSLLRRPLPLLSSFVRRLDWLLMLGRPEVFRLRA